MIKKTLLVAVLLFCNVLIFAQNQPMNNTTRDALNLGGLKLGSNTVSGISSIVGPRGQVLGDYYLDSTWRLGSIKLYQKIGSPGREGDSIANVPIRFDMFQNDLEIMASAKDIKGVEGAKVRFFLVNDALGMVRTYLNIGELKCEDNIKGFVEIVTSGRASLVQYIKIGVSKPTYNEALGTGSKDTKILKTPQFYYLRGRTLARLGNSKKKIAEALGDQAEAIEKFIKDNNLDTKSRTDLVRIFEHYNQL
jgi:hypothetical protein